MSAGTVDAELRKAPSRDSRRSPSAVYVGTCPPRVPAANAASAASHSSASIGPSTARTCASPSGSVSTRSRSRAKRCHCSGSRSTTGTSGGKNGTYTRGARAAEAGPRPSGRVGAQVDDQRRGRRLVVAQVHAHADLLSLRRGLDERRDRMLVGGIVGTGCAPGSAAVVAQRRDDVGDRAVGRIERTARDARAGRGERWSAIHVGVSGARRRSKSSPAATSADARVQSVVSETRFEIDVPSSHGPRRPGAAARLDDPASVRVDDEERREVRLVDAGSPLPPWPCASSAAVIARTRSSAVPSSFEAEPTRSMPRRPARCARGSSTVQIFSLPIATPCSLHPCSAPQSHVGCEPTNADAPRSSMRRYCVASVPPATRARCGSSTCASPGGRSEFFANTMPARVRRHRVSHMPVSAAAT